MVELVLGNDNSLHDFPPRVSPRCTDFGRFGDAEIIDLLAVPVARVIDTGARVSVPCAKPDGCARGLPTVEGL